MDIWNNFSIQPQLIKGIHWDPHKICDIFSEVKRETYIIGKHQMFISCYTVIQFTQQPRNILKRTAPKTQKIELCHRLFKFKIWKTNLSYGNLVPDV